MLPNEAAATAELVRNVISPLSYYSERAREAETAKYTAQGLCEIAAQDEYAVIVARFDKDLVGFCISRYDDGLIWLAWFGVRADWRGTDAAVVLLRALDDSVQARGCVKIWCDTRTENLRSQRVLKREGYRMICTLTRHWYGHDFHLWEKYLESGDA
jgi:RimJ/RimL family protein N-acetyltransferase